MADSKSTASPLPVRVDASAYCDRRVELGGQVALKHLKRLEALLSSSQPDFANEQIAVDLSFDRDELKQAIVEGRFSGHVASDCQRCGEPVRYRLDVSRVFGLARKENEFELMSEEYEPVLLDKGVLEVHQMVEDELLLTLPQFPLHKAVELEKNMAEGIAEKTAHVHVSTALIPECDTHTIIELTGSGSSLSTMQPQSAPVDLAVPAETHKPFKGLEALLKPKQ